MRYERFHDPHPRVSQRIEVLYPQAMDGAVAPRNPLLAPINKPVNPIETLTGWRCNLTTAGVLRA